MNITENDLQIWATSVVPVYTQRFKKQRESMACVQN